MNKDFYMVGDDRPNLADPTAGARPTLSLYDELDNPAIWQCAKCKERATIRSGNISYCDYHFDTMPGKPPIW